MWFLCFSPQLPALHHIAVCTLSKIPGFTQISWQAFSTHCCNTSKSLISSEHTKVFRCPHSQKSRWFKIRGSCRPLDWASIFYPLSAKSLVQLLSDSAQKMRSFPSIHVLLMKKHIFQEY
jgi:hypothetical protein